MVAEYFTINLNNHNTNYIIILKRARWFLTANGQLVIQYAFAGKMHLKKCFWPHYVSS